MNNKQLQTTTVLRFRRWSRAGYAVFRSLGCNVSIGVLAASVNEKAATKSELISFTNNTFAGIIYNDFEEEQGTENQIIVTGLLNFIIKQPSDCAIAGSQNINIHPNG